MTYPKVATQSEKLCFSKGLVTKAAFTSPTRPGGLESILEKGLWLGGKRLEDVSLTACQAELALPCSRLGTLKSEWTGSPEKNLWPRVTG